jgi:hypothetical protein
MVKLLRDFYIVTGMNFDSSWQGYTNYEFKISPIFARLTDDIYDSCYNYFFKDENNPSMSKIMT